MSGATEISYTHRKPGILREKKSNHVGFATMKEKNRKKIQKFKNKKFERRICC